MAKQVPSVGRVVHYVAYGTPGGEFPAGVCRAAVITQVGTEEPYTVGLFVMNPKGNYFNDRVEFNGQMNAPGTWHWPEYVAAEEPDHK